jgi:hypothetical protein
MNIIQEDLYHCRTFEDLGHRHPSSISKVNNMITSCTHEEGKVIAKYESNHSRGKNNSSANNNNNKNKVREAVTTTTTRGLIASASQTTLSWQYNAHQKTTPGRSRAAPTLGTCSLRDKGTPGSPPTRVPEVSTKWIRLVRSPADLQVGPKTYP